MKERSLNLDLYRAFALILMVIFHFAYDLHYFGFTDINTTRVAFWVYLRAIIVTLFMSAVGMSLYLVYIKEFNANKYYKRLVLLGGTSVLISLVTYFIFPHSWIYFGVIHMVLIASLIGPFFVKKPNISAVIGISIILMYFLGYKMTFLFDILQVPLHLPTRHTEDLAPLLPWFGVVLLGIFAMHHNLINRITIKTNTLTKRLAWLGSHTLVIYLTHQGVLFAILGSLSYLLK